MSLVELLEQLGCVIREFEEANIDEDRYQKWGTVNFCYSKLVPLPSLDADPYEIWGTKWPSTNELKIQDEGEYDNGEGYYVVYTFYSAWSPVIPWLEAIRPLFPELDFDLEYHECGVNIHGCVSIRGQDITRETWRE